MKAGWRDAPLALRDSVMSNMHDFKFSKESIEFLDTLVYIDSKKKLQTTLYKKPTDCQIDLHAKSAHPFTLRKSIPYSQALRIKCICSTLEE